MKLWIKGGLIGALVGIPIAIIISILQYSSSLSGFSRTTNTYIDWILISIVASGLLGILLALIIKKETRKIGILSILGGLVGLGIGAILSLFICGFESCSGFRAFIINPIGYLFALLRLQQFSAFLAMVTWFALGAFILNLIVNALKK